MTSPRHVLTGMLAELKSDLNKELESHKLKGAMKQITDKDDMDAVAEIRSLLEKASEAESSSVGYHNILLSATKCIS